MKKSLTFTIIVFLISILSAGAQEMKLDDVLNAYYKASGTEKMKDWTTLTVKGKTIAQGVEFPITLIMKRPSRLRTEAEVQGMKLIQAFDGQQGWSITPWSGSSAPQYMTPDEIRIVKEQTDMEGPLYHWKEKGGKAELLGKEDMEGNQVYKIKLTKASGDIDISYIDAESFILLKTDSKVTIQGNETESESLYTNYKDLGGVLMATTITNKMKDQVISQLVIEKTELNLPVSDSLFMKPVVNK
jgi:hypothetical protein